jgi:plastocyanin
MIMLALATRIPLSVALLIAVGCGSSSSSGGGDPIDAAPDSPTGPPVPAAQAVDCPTVVAAEITTGNNEYLPNPRTVKPGSIVRFTLGKDHTLRSNSNLFFIDFGQTECVKFNTAGSYDYYCTAHSFIGKVIVQ